MEESWKGGCVLLVVYGCSRLKVHPPQQVLEARVVRRHIIQLTNIGHATPPETKSRLEERSLN